MEEIINILIVEDDADLQEVYALILRSEGFRVEVASDGLHAFEILKTFTPDFILLDYFMPRMDGKNFLENFDTKDFPNTKIVVASNVSDASVLDEMMNLGAEKAVLKADLSPRQLLGLVDAYVGRS